MNGLTIISYIYKISDTASEKDWDVIGEMNWHILVFWILQMQKCTPTDVFTRAMSSVSPLCVYRGLFIIDDKGNLRQITMNDLPVGRSVDETLRLVQAFQFTDKHGEVCPAGWKPGAETMKPNPKESKSYFQKHA